MITRSTKIKLAIFLLITLVGTSFVGAKYAHLGALFYNDHYTVTAKLMDSGGLYQGAEVDYRGVRVGSVGSMKLTPTGVDAGLDIGNKWSIPADAKAVVANRSAVGEQFIDIQPASDAGPYLKNGSEITKTEIPLSVKDFLGDTAETVHSIDRSALKTSVAELGAAFGGTGVALGQILDTGTSFVQTADKNFATTAALIKDSNTVLSTQVGQAGAIRSFARDLSLFSDTLASSNPDLLKLLRTGSAGALELKSFLDQYGVNLGELISKAVTTGQIVQRRLPGIQQVLIMYPGVLDGAFSVIQRDPTTGHLGAVFGLALANNRVCENGYGSTVHRGPQDGRTRELNLNARCTEPITQSNPRGAQNLPPRAPVAFYNPATHQVTWNAGATSTLNGTIWGWLGAAEGNG